MVCVTRLQSGWTAWVLSVYVLTKSGFRMLYFNNPEKLLRLSCGTYGPLMAAFGHGRTLGATRQFTTLQAARAWHAMFNRCCCELVSMLCFVRAPRVLRAGRNIM